MKLPIIAIPCRIRSELEEKGEMYGALSSYVEAVKAAEGLPFLIPPLKDEGMITTLLSKADGLLLTGGEDIDPKWYKTAAHPKLGTVSEARDFLEITAVRYAYNNKLPTLGICRGIQIINVALGGTLYQDLPSEYNSNIKHNDTGDCYNLEKLSHSITIAPQSILAKIIGSEETKTNSFHHQAVKELAPGFQITATAPDGVIEAIEALNHPFCIGVQSHPEILWSNIEKRWSKLFKVFVDTASD